MSLDPISLAHRILDTMEPGQLQFFFGVSTVRNLGTREFGTWTVASARRWPTTREFSRLPGNEIMQHDTIATSKGSVQVQSEDFDPGLELTRLAGPGAGGIASFIGIVRGGSGPNAVLAMTLEHYPGMTENALNDIVAQACLRWPLLDARIVHRYGRLTPGERIVFAAAVSHHRMAAQEACAFMVDWLKTQAPFWKCEEYATGKSWVQAKTSDDEAAQRWQQKSPTTDTPLPDHAVTLPSMSKTPRTFARMRSGRCVHLLDPNSLDLEIDDLVLGISRVHRWCGQTTGEYGFSVAQHSVIVEAILTEMVSTTTPSKQARLWALCHDLPEALLGDLVTPVKAVVRGYTELENRMAVAVRLLVGLPAKLPAAIARDVTKADRIAAVTEATRLAGWAEKDARRDVGRDVGRPYRGPLWAGELTPWPEAVAKENWQRRFDDVTGKN